MYISKELENLSAHAKFPKKDVCVLSSFMQMYENQQNIPSSEE